MLKNSRNLELLSVVILLLFAGCSLISRESDTLNYLSIADTYYSEFEYDKALEYYLLAAETENDNGETYYKIGLIYGTYHNQKHPNESIIGGRQNQQTGVIRREGSDFSLSVKYLRKAAELGHVGARQILRVMHDNIQDLDVKY